MKTTWCILTFRLQLTIFASDENQLIPKVEQKENLKTFHMKGTMYYCLLTLFAQSPEFAWCSVVQDFN